MSTPDTCTACGALKKIESENFINFACGATYGKIQKSFVNKLWADHEAANTQRAEITRLRDLLAERDELIAAQVETIAAKTATVDEGAVIIMQQLTENNRLREEVKSLRYRVAVAED